MMVANVQWNPVMKNFGEQWKAIKDHTLETPPDVPKITKILTNSFVD